MLKLVPLLLFSNPVIVQPIGLTPFGERTSSFQFAAQHMSMGGGFLIAHLA